MLKAKTLLGHIRSNQDDSLVNKIIRLMKAASFYLFIYLFCVFDQCKVREKVYDYHNLTFLVMLNSKPHKRGDPSCILFRKHIENNILLSLIGRMCAILSHWDCIFLERKIFILQRKTNKVALGCELSWH
jgi:hypothetical protein